MPLHRRPRRQAHEIDDAQIAASRIAPTRLIAERRVFETAGPVFRKSTYTQRGRSWPGAVSLRDMPVPSRPADAPLVHLADALRPLLAQ